MPTLVYLCPGIIFKIFNNAQGRNIQEHSGWHALTFYLLLLKIEGSDQSEKVGWEFWARKGAQSSKYLWSERLVIWGHIELTINTSLPLTWQLINISPAIARTGYYQALKNFLLEFQKTVSHWDVKVMFPQVLI